MGIIAHCPGGHRINVKEHLAGKKGICPTCGQKFRIPLASGRSVSELPGGPSDVPIAAVVSLDPAVASTLPAALPLAESTSAVGDGPAVRGAEPAPEQEVDVVEQAAEQPADIPSVIAEAPSAWWCIAVPGGAPSAAMPGDAMLAWLASGGATGEEVVWRSDWADWRPLAVVFPAYLPTRNPLAW